MKIVADINIPYIKGVLEPYAEVAYMRGADIGPEDIKDADALLVRTRTRCDAGLLRGSAVSFIATATIGTDHIDLPWCAANGVEVVSAAGCNAGGVLQWIGAALALTAAQGGWRPDGKTIGVVGAGNVGSLVARYARLWGFCVLCSDPPREQAEGLGRADGFVPFGELAAESDIITFHTPLTRSGDYPTYNMGGERFLGLVKPGAVIINCARGGVVDESAMLRAIDAKQLTCCIDTWEGEPDINRPLLAACAISTPHIAGYSAQGKANASAMSIAALARRFGLPLEGWYPAEVRPVLRRAIGWEDMAATIKRYCDLRAESALLKQRPENFERTREEYDYREEYF